MRLLRRADRHRVDLSAGSVSYIEDCQVCCQPLLVHLECDDAGQLLRGWAERGD